MAAGRLLVVSPNDDLRRSLVFALEAEGFEVMALSQLPSAKWAAEHRFECTVLHQKAVSDDGLAEAISFCIRSHPVVLLAPNPPKSLADWVSAVVETPIAGDALVAAVYGAIDAALTGRTSA